MIIRTGIDIIEIARLAELNPVILKRFIRRVFTDQEIEDCGESNASLAGRFAAKEAVAKALGCGIAKAGWRNIEILRVSNGEPVLHLHGPAQEYANSLNLEQWTLSISHSRSHAIAVAIAVGQRSLS